MRRSVCDDCRYECKQTPKASDPARTRQCWQCRSEFVSTDFTQRICSPACRSARSRRQTDGEIITAADKKQITNAMKRIGLHRRRFIPGWVGEARTRPVDKPKRFLSLFPDGAALLERAGRVATEVVRRCYFCGATRSDLVRMQSVDEWRCEDVTDGCGRRLVKRG